MKRKRNFTIVMALLLICIIGIGFAYLSTNLTINGTANVGVPSWDVHFDNIKVTSGSVSGTQVVTAPTLSDTTTTSFKVKLDDPGDFYEFTIDVVNEGSIDAMIDSINTGSLTTAQAKYLDYSVTYEDGSAINTKDLVKVGNSETLKVSIKFKKELEAADLPSSDVEISMPIQLVYIQNDGGNAIVHMTLTDTNENGTADVGEVINIRSESFYVISNTSGTIKALAKYNLLAGSSYDGVSVINIDNPTGIQDSSALGYSTSTPYIGTTAFSSSNYWTTGDGTTVDLTSSNINSHLNTYKTTLNNYGGVVSNVGLISTSDLTALGCTSSACGTTYSWLYDTSYWTSTIAGTDTIYGVLSFDSIMGLSYSDNSNLGIRPVITISASDLN